MALEAALTQGGAHRPVLCCCIGLPDGSGMFREAGTHTGPAEAYLRDSCSVNTEQLRWGRGAQVGGEGTS